jgi:phosphoserine phosphatase
MLELLALLKDRGFKVYIVSGGGVDFMRAVLADVYGIPSANVLGSLGNTAIETKDGNAEVVKMPGIAFVNDKEGKVVSIEKIIGRRPAMAFGNSDGDLAMLQYTAQGGSKTFMGLVHHTDAEREWSYDKDSSVGKLDKALTEATDKGWAVVDMKADWKVVYPQ